MRIEDIDQGRCRADHVAGIYEDLRWLGLTWDEPVVLQSERQPFYDAALNALKARGLVYPCWCTRAEIAEAGGAPQGQQSLYPGTCKNRPDPRDGRTPCWRLDCAAALAQTGPLTWHDAQAGPVEAAPHLLGDVVLARKDAGTSYHMAVVVDDAAQGVTDVVRGQDLRLSTHIHRLLQALLTLQTPRYWHHALVLDGEGERLAKRRHSPTLAALRDKGVDPRALVDALRAGRLPDGYSLSA